MKITRFNISETLTKGQIGELVSHAELEQRLYEELDLSIDQTSFDQITAKKVDLSGSTLISLVGWQSLKGTTIDSLQLLASATQIVTALGLKVKE
jgi:hypothetical protein